MTHNDINELVRQDKAVRVGPDVFYISKHELLTIKKAVKYTCARPRKRDWLQIAARPLVAKKLVSLIDELGVESGCEEWGRQNRDAEREAGLLSDDTLLMGNDGEPVRAGDIDKPKAERIRVLPEMVECDCGHECGAAMVMSASMGTACPDCYDMMSD
jgi:hypothetical protein